MMLTETAQSLSSLFERLVQDSRYEDINRQGWDAFVQNGFPSRRDEEYKFTGLEGLLKNKFSFENAIQASSSNIDVEFIDVEGHHLVFRNGQFDASSSNIVEDAGFSITSFDDLSLDEVARLIAKQKDQRPTVAINQAFFNGGLAIEVSRSATPKPIFIYHVLDKKQDSVSFPRIDIEVAENAQLHIYERQIGSGSARHFSSFVTTMNVEANAQARYSKIQDYTASDIVLDNFFVNQAKNSYAYVNTFSFSGNIVRNNLEMNINDEHSEANMYGLYLLDEKSHVDNHTVVDHKVPNCQSNELYKGILDDSSTGVFNGKIFVRPDAQKTNAYQTNNNIALSDNATIHTKPQLEIWADDVSCSHGCTIGQLDEEALFYLIARGINPIKARSMMLEAFSQEALSNVKEEKYVEIVRNKIHERLEA